MTLADSLRLEMSVLIQEDANTSRVDALLVDVARMERRLDEQMRDAQEDAEMAERRARIAAATNVTFLPPRPGIRARGPGDAA